MFKSREDARAAVATMERHLPEIAAKARAAGGVVEDGGEWTAERLRGVVQDERASRERMFFDALAGALNDKRGRR